jgi:hypothetical protein
VLLAALGGVVLLYAYRILCKTPGRDKKYDAAVALQSPNVKVTG